jgi:arylsulfatase
MPTFAAAAGVPDITDKLKKGTSLHGKQFKVYLDGYNLLPYLKGDAKKNPREEYFYFDQTGNLNAVRWNDWKVQFAMLKGNIATGTREVTGWPTIVNLRADPWEQAPFESGMYIRWYADLLWLFVPVQEKIKGFLSSIPDYPFQQGSSLSAGTINYMTLKAADALKRLHEIETFAAPSN